MSEIKRCVKCALEKPLHDFHRLSRSPDGRRDECADCRNEARRITRTADYDALFVEQKGRCAICGIDSEAYGKRFSVDHDHEQGFPRALLCSHCNTLVGMADEDVEILKAAIGYLMHHKTQIVS